MINIRLYENTIDFDNDNIKRNELDYTVSLDSKSGNVYISNNKIILKYITTSSNQSIKLFYNQIIMDRLVQKCKILEPGEGEISTYQYTFQNSGDHEVEIEWKPGVTNFSDCFYGCWGLTEIPENLFSNNIEVVNFDDCFYNCTGLVGSTPKDTDGGELWERQGKPSYPSSISGSRCFFPCMGLGNYSDIPSEWK